MDDSLNLKEIPMEYLEQIIGAIDVTKMNMWEVVQHVYRATYMRYSVKFFEEKMAREKLEEKMIAKVKLIDSLESDIKSLKEQLDAACQKNKELYEGTQVSTSSEEKTV